LPFHGFSPCVPRRPSSWRGRYTARHRTRLLWSTFPSLPTIIHPCARFVCYITSHRPFHVSSVRFVCTPHHTAHSPLCHSTSLPSILFPPSHAAHYIASQSHPIHASFHCTHPTPRLRASRSCVLGPISA
jgi:hypothetical protein